MSIVSPRIPCKPFKYLIFLHCSYDLYKKSFPRVSWINCYKFHYYRRIRVKFMSVTNSFVVTDIMLFIGFCNSMATYPF